MAAISLFFLVKSFVTLLVIIDPVGNVPIFLGITKSFTLPQRHRAAGQSVAVAAVVIALFAVFGQQILTYLGITMASLEAAGGLLLLIVALSLLRGEIAELRGAEGGNVAFVPLGTPLLAGPGSIAATMVFMRQATTVGDRISLALGLLGVFVVLWLTLRFAGLMLRVLREAGIDLITRISGLLLTAIAVQLVAGAVRQLARAHG